MEDDLDLADILRVSIYLGHGKLGIVQFANFNDRGHGGRVVKLSPPTSEAGVRFLAWPQVGKLVVPCRWSAVYSIEP